MNKYVYNIMCKVDMSVFPSVATTLGLLNDHMKEFGFNEKIGMTSTTSIGTISVARMLLPNEKATMLGIIQQQFSADTLLKKFRVEELELI